MKRNERKNQVLEALNQDGEATIIELAQKLRATQKAIDGAIRKLKASKLVYVKEWRRNVGTSGREYRVFALGNKRDAPRPKTYERISVVHRYEEKHKLIRKLKRRAKAHGASPWDSLIVI